MTPSRRFRAVLAMLGAIVLAAASIPAASIAVAANGSPLTPEPATTVPPPPGTAVPSVGVQVADDGALLWTDVPRRSGPGHTYVLPSGSSAPIDLGVLDGPTLNGHVVGSRLSSHDGMYNTTLVSSFALLDLTTMTSSTVTLGSDEGYVGQTGDGGYLYVKQTASPALCALYDLWYQPVANGTAVDIGAVYDGPATGGLATTDVHGHQVVFEMIDCSPGVYVGDADAKTVTKLVNDYEVARTTADKVTVTNDAKHVRWWLRNSFVAEAGHADLPSGSGFAAVTGTTLSYVSTSGLQTVATGTIDVAHPAGVPVEHPTLVVAGDVRGALSDGAAIVVGKASAAASPAIIAASATSVQERTSLTPPETSFGPWAVGGGRLAAEVDDSGTPTLAQWPLTVSGSTVVVGARHDTVLPALSGGDTGSNIEFAGPFTAYAGYSNAIPYAGHLYVYNASGQTVLDIPKASYRDMSPSTVSYAFYDAFHSQGVLRTTNLVTGATTDTPNVPIAPDGGPHGEVRWTRASASTISGYDFRTATSRTMSVPGCDITGVESSLDRWVLVDCGYGSWVSVDTRDGIVSAPPLNAAATAPGQTIVGNGYVLADASNRGRLYDMANLSSAPRDLGPVDGSLTAGQRVLSTDSSGGDIFGSFTEEGNIVLSTAPIPAPSGPVAAPGAPVLKVPAIASSAAATKLLPVAWNASGATSYTVTLTTRRGAGGKVITSGPVLLSTGAATSSILTVVPGSTQTITVVAMNAGGSSGATSASVVVPFDQGLLKYAGHWTTRRNAKDWLGSDRLGAPRATATATITGRRLTIIGSHCPSCGKLTVIVDGHPKATVDEKGKSALRVALATITLGPKAGSHKVVLKVIGKKAAIDGLAVALG